VRGERPGLEGAVITLAEAGIVDVDRMSRRDLLGASAAVSALLVTSVLSAAAAASSIDGAGSGDPVASVVGASTTLVTEYSVTVDGVPHQLFRVAHDTFNTSNAALVREFQLSAPREVDVLLVGGGGGGGNIDTSNVDFRTGGGGAGEVHQLSLGVVEAGSSIVVTVGALVAPGTSGNETKVAVDGVTVAQARGGGRGAGNGTVATSGGSGGGGRSSAVEAERSAAAAGTAGTGTGVSQRADGADGADADAGGGGGAGGNGTAGGAGGGQGGDGVDIAPFLGSWDGVASDPLLGRYVAGGGGGGGLSAGGAGGSVGGVTLGGVGVKRSDLVATGSARHGTLGTGSGGGGGAADGIEAAAGTGASGVAWIRVRLEAPS